MPGIEVGQVGVGFNPQSFVNSDAYNFINQQGGQAIERSAAAKGTLNTGGTLKDLLRFGQGNASTFWGNQLDHDYRMAALNAGISEGNAGRTLSGLTSLSSLGAGAAGNAGNYLADAGVYGARGTIGQQNAWNGAVGTIGNTLGEWFARRRGPQGVAPPPPNGGYTTQPYPPQGNDGMIPPR